MRITTMSQAEKMLGKWRYAFFASLLVCVVVYVGYAVYVLTFTPERQEILLNQMGGVYRSEDLSKTNVSEGEVKQFTYKVLKNTFQYHYVGFKSPVNYGKLISGEDSSDLPDHRDALSPYYTEGAHSALVQSLENSPWSDGFYAERRQVRATFTSPPEKVTSDGFYVSQDNRLRIDYKGVFYLRVIAKGEKTKRFRIDYSVTLERKPLLFEARQDSYYFQPMVKRNTFEWRIFSLDWTAERNT